MAREDKTNRRSFWEGASAAALVAVLAALAWLGLDAAQCDGTQGAGQPPSAPSAAEVIEPSPVEWGLSSFDYADVPAYEGSPSVTLADGTPFFGDEDFSRGVFEEYGELDSLGRATGAFALVAPGTLATGDRPAVKTEPTGFQLVRYDWISGKYLYNRCHLIAYKLSGAGDEPRDLVTGTRYLNVDGMGPYERAVQSYVEETGNGVLYRVTPVFDGDDMVCRGVLVEAASYEDRGETLRICAWCYNVQPGVEIDYATGDNRADGTVEAALEEFGYKYLINKDTKVFHMPDCPTGSTVKESNRLGSNDSREELIEQGYRPCGSCKP